MSHQYPESQKRQTIPREPKVPDNTWRAKSARQYPESQKRQTIPGEPITLFFFQNCFENKKRGKYYSVYIKMFLNNYHFYQIMTRIIPIEPSIPGEPKAPDNTWRAKSARQYLESQKRQTIPREPITFFFKIALKMKKRQVLLNLHKNVLGQLPFLSNNDQNNTIEPSIPGEPKVPDNTRRAKSARQYLESQLLSFFSQNCFLK